MSLLERESEALAHQPSQLGPELGSAQALQRHFGAEESGQNIVAERSGRPEPDPVKVVTAFSELYAEFAAGKKDPLGILAAAQDPSIPNTPANLLQCYKRTVNTLASAAPIGLTLGTLPTVLAGTVILSTALFDYSKGRCEQDDFIKSNQYDPLTANRLWANIGVKGHAWFSSREGKLFIEPAPAINERSHAGMIVRLQRFEQIIDSANLRHQFGGYVTPMRADGYSMMLPNPKTLITFNALTQLYFDTPYPTKHRMLWQLHDTLLTQKEDTGMLSPTEQLLADLAALAPNHRLLTAAAKGASPQSIARLALEIYADNQTDVHRTEHGRARPQLTFLPNAVLETTPTGARLHRPPRYQPNVPRASGRSQTAINALLYAIGSGNANHLPPPTGTSTTSDILIADTWLMQAEVTYRLSLSDNHCRRIEAYPFSGRLRRLADGTYNPNGNSTIQHNAPRGVSLPEALRQMGITAVLILGSQAVGSALEGRTGFDYMPLNDFALEAIAALNTKTGSAGQDLLPFSISITAPNNPLWTVTYPISDSGEQQANPSGYWDLQGFSQYGDIGNGSFGWLAGDADVETFRQLNESGKFNDESSLPATPPDNVDFFGVYGYMRADTIFTSDDGASWAAMHVPVLHNHSILSTHISVLSHESSTATEPDALPTIVVFGSSGPLLFVKLPAGIEQGDTTLSVAYTVSTHEQPGTKTIAPIFTDETQTTVTEFAPNSGQETIAQIMSQRAITEYGYSLHPVAGEDTNDDGIYNLTDTAAETVASGLMECVISGTLFIGEHSNEYAGAGGILLSDQDVQADAAQGNLGVTLLNSHGAHFYAVSVDGTIHDATPMSFSNTTDQAEFAAYSARPEINLSDNNADITVNTSSYSVITPSPNPVVIPNGAPEAILGITAAAVGVHWVLRRLRKHRIRGLVDPDNPKNAVPRALILLAGYKLNGANDPDPARTSTLVTKSDILTYLRPIIDAGGNPTSTTAVADASIRHMKPEIIATLLNRDVKVQTSAAPYTTAHIRRAVRIAKALQLPPNRD